MAGDRLEAISRTVQVVSIVAGVVVSVLSFNQNRAREVHAREAEAQNRQIESAKPFLDLRQRLYVDAVQQAAILANPEVHGPAERTKAKKRFRELYVAELSMIEGIDVARAMVKLAAQVDPVLLNMTPRQRAAYDLSHALRNSLVTSWNLDEQLIGNP